MMYDCSVVLAAIAIATFAGFYLSLFFIITWCPTISSFRGFKCLSYIVYSDSVIPSCGAALFHCSGRGCPGLQQFETIIISSVSH